MLLNWIFFATSQKWTNSLKKTRSQITILRFVYIHTWLYVETWMDEKFLGVSGVTTPIAPCIRMSACPMSHKVYPQGLPTRSTHKVVSHGLPSSPIHIDYPPGLPCSPTRGTPRSGVHCTTRTMQPHQGNPKIRRLLHHQDYAAPPGVPLDQASVAPPGLCSPTRTM